MGTMNLLQSKWDGKVGQLVGAKWKNKATVHALTKPKDAQTDSQLKQRAWFKPMQKTCFLYAQFIKGYTNISHKNMGLGNALIKFNKGLDIGANHDQLQNIKLAKTDDKNVFGWGVQYEIGSISIEFRWWDNKPIYDDAEIFTLVYNTKLGTVDFNQYDTLPQSVTIQRKSPYDEHVYYYIWGRRKVNGKYVYLKQSSGEVPI